MPIIKCKMCGGDLRIEEGHTVCECEYCGTRQTVPSADNEKKLTLFSRAGRLLRGCEFDKAAGVFEAIVADFPEEAEAYWGLVLCKYGIEYVDDPATGKKIPTCHRSSFDSVLDDPNYEQACENTDAVARRVYRDEARQIEDLRKRIIEVSGKEEPYDVFISYKETDEKGDRTIESVIAQDIYTELTEKGYRVFFSRISLEDKLGTEYEPYIFAALNSAKVMLVVGTDYENFDSVWVKNEWSIASGQKKTLIPVFKNMDAYDMPKEFAKLAAQDMGKVGAMQDLVRGVEKITGKKKETIIYRSEGDMKTAAAIKRGYLALEGGEFDQAEEYFEQVLTLDAECAEAYLGAFLAETKYRNEAEYIRDACLQNGETETLTVPMETDIIEKAVKENVVRGFLEENEIRNLFHYDLRFPSTLKSQRRIKDEEKQFFENNRNLSLAFRFAKGETVERLNIFKTQLFEGLDKSVVAAKENENAARNAKADAYKQFLLSAKEKATLLNRKAKRRKTLRGKLIVFAVGAFACVVAFNIYKSTVLTPAKNYKQASLLLESGQYKDAMVIFENLGDYKDSAIKLEETKQFVLDQDYLSAEKLLAACSYEEALKAFENLGNYKDSQTRCEEIKNLILERDYADADALLTSGEYEKAIAAFQSLGDYKDSPARCEEIKNLILERNYAEADALLASGEYEEAFKAFESLGAFKDSKEKCEEITERILERDYAEAIKLFELGEYQDAFDAFCSLSNTSRVIEFYLEKANQGNVYALNDIGNLYYNGIGINQDYSEALKWYEKAAEAGSNDAMNNIGMMYNYGRGVKQDYKNAMDWYNKAADNGNNDAIYNIGVLYEFGRGVTQDYKKAMKWYEKAAEAGNASAMFRIGKLYNNGNGIEQNYTIAMQWYERAVNAGNTDAMFNIGVLFNFGEGVTQDYKKAMEWYEKSADAGESVAMYNIGVLYHFGYGVPQDYKKAMDWYKKAVDAGDTNSMNNIGVLYDNGLGVAQDYAVAMEWYKKAADAGNAKAMFNIAQNYANGEGVAKDYQEAMKWYEKAADAGNADAMNSIGVLYQHGRGVTQDYKMAMKWYKKAADAGNATAMHNIGVLYEKGYGVWKSDKKANEWYEKAKAAGYQE